MPRPNRLADEAIFDILTAHHISHSEMGRRHDRSHQAIAQIRNGQTHADRLPEIPRWTTGRTCEQCQHWARPGHCSLGFPDPLVESTAFAGDCACFAGVTA
jgi:anti-sigma factor RsiW